MYCVMSIIHPKVEIITRSVMNKSYQKITLPACWSWVLLVQLLFVSHTTLLSCVQHSCLSQDSCFLHCRVLFVVRIDIYFLWWLCYRNLTAWCRTVGSTEPSKTPTSASLVRTSRVLYLDFLVNTVTLKNRRMEIPLTWTLENLT